MHSIPFHSKKQVHEAPRTINFTHDAMGKWHPLSYLSSQKSAKTCDLFHKVCQSPREVCAATMNSSQKEATWTNLSKQHDSMRSWCKILMDNYIIGTIRCVFSLVIATSFAEMPSPQGTMSTLDMSMSAPDNAWRPTFQMPGDQLLFTCK